MRQVSLDKNTRVTFQIEYKRYDPLNPFTHQTKQLQKWIIRRLWVSGWEGKTRQCHMPFWSQVSRTLPNMFVRRLCDKIFNELYESYLFPRRSRFHSRKGDWAQIWLKGGTGTGDQSNFFCIVSFWAIKTILNSRHFARKYINNSLHLARKYARIFIRGQSVPRSEQFSESEARGKLWAARNR